jgi:hypothetical protein
MKLTVILITVGLLSCIVFLTACKKGGPQADAESAVAQGDYQFIALLDAEGKWTRPQVPEIPAWYFETTGIRIRQTTLETRDADLAYMKSYNDALYQALKSRGKFGVIEENIARMKANLDKAKK